MLVCAVTIRGVIQICLSVSGLCVVMWVVVGGGFIVVCRRGSVCNQIKHFYPLTITYIVKRTVDSRGISLLSLKQ